MNPDQVPGQLGPCQLRATNHVTILIASGVTNNTIFPELSDFISVLESISLL